MGDESSNEIIRGGSILSNPETAVLPVRSGPTGYMPALDGLRALGISLVFVHHMITPFVFGGQVGVDVFFVLSGFLITTILLQEWGQFRRINFGRFYLRRAIRLYPALLLAIVFLLAPGLIFAPSALNYVAENLFAVTYTTPVALQIADGAAKAWRHTWSLGIEEMFYFLWPLILVLGLRRRFSLALMAAVVGLGGIAMLVIPVVMDLVGNQSLLLRSGGLFIGCSLALIMRASDRLAANTTCGVFGIILIAAAVAIATVYHADEAAVVLACLGTAALIAHASTRPSSWLSRFFSTKPVAYLGRISYELYIWHYPVLVLLAWATKGDFASVAWIAAPLSLGVAIATHELLKSPVSFWKQRIL